MSNKRMLTEGTVRRFMKLARVDSLSDNFVNEMYSSPMEEDEDTNEGHCMEEDMMDVSEEDGTLEAGFEGQADADGIEAMQEVDYTSHGDVDEDMMYGEGMFDEDMEEDVMEEDMMEEEEDKLQGEEIFMAESLQRDPSVAWLFEQDEEDEPIEDEEEEGDEQEDMPIDDEMDDEMGDPEEDMPMDDAMGEADISLTEEEAELLISLGERLKEAMEEGDAAEPVEDDGDITDEMPVGDEDEEEEEPEADQEELIQEILRRVTKRIMNQKLSRK